MIFKSVTHVVEKQCCLVFLHIFLSFSKVFVPLISLDDLKFFLSFLRLRQTYENNAYNPIELN